MKYKLVVIDLDHTLLREDKTISNVNKEAIAKCIEAGLYVLIATGRTHRAAKEYAEQMGIDWPMINCQGAIISDSQGQIAYHLPISNQVSREIIEVLKSFNIDIIFCHGSDVYGTCNTPTQKEYMAKVNRKHLPMPEDIGAIEVTKVGAAGEPAHIHQAYEAIKEKYADEVNTCKSARNFLEITNKEATKSAAVHQLGEHCGIQKEEIIAFGDSMNDVDLLQYAGFGVAVANAMDELKSVADVITDSNEDDGVAKAIYQYVLID